MGGWVCSKTSEYRTGWIKANTYPSDPAQESHLFFYTIYRSLLICILLLICKLKNNKV